MTKKITLTLTQAECDEIKAWPAGNGGFQSYRTLLIPQLQKGNTVEFDDAMFGQLFRQMFFYGKGGFQSRLKKAFKRPVEDLFK